MGNESWVLSGSLIIACGVLLLLLVFSHHAARKLDVQEPPVVSSTIPYVGHIIGMIVYGGRYTKRIACKHSPIFTMPMPGSRMYIVTDPALAANVQKTKSLSFNPIIPEVTQRILGLDEKTLLILRTNIGREQGSDGFYPEVHDLVYSTMTPGDRLDELTTSATDMFRKHVDAEVSALRSHKSGSSVEDLLLWTQHLVTVATAEFLYGPQNPIASDPSLEGAFWDFDHGLGQLLAFAGLMPAITARKAFKGREAVVSALLHYFEKGHYRSSSPLILQRVEIAQKYGMSWDGIARSELSFLFAGIVNTAITSYWLVVHIFARPDLLAAVREELRHCPSTTAPSSGSPTLDPQEIANSCPLLLSVYRETLRLGSDNSSHRLATSDTLLADKYFLAKGSVVQISGAAMHVDQGIWGEDVNTFEAHRFTPGRLKVKSVHPPAFRAFGGGTTICPGRHFATREILYFAALIVAMFDIEAVDGGLIAIPSKKDNVLPVHILEPVDKMLVKMKPSRSDED